MSTNLSHFLHQSVGEYQRAPWKHDIICGLAVAMQRCESMARDSSFPLLPIYWYSIETIVWRNCEMIFAPDKRDHGADKPIWGISVPFVFVEFKDADGANETLAVGVRIDEPPVGANLSAGDRVLVIEGSGPGVDRFSHFQIVGESQAREAMISAFTRWRAWCVIEAAETESGPQGGLAEIQQHKDPLVGPPAPVVAKDHLTSWFEITEALNMPNDQQSRNKVRQLHEAFSGPIKFGTNGKQPMVERGDLLQWWNSIGYRHEELQARDRDRQATVAETYDYGRSGSVMPGVGGSQKTRRKRQ